MAQALAIQQALVRWDSAYACHRHTRSLVVAEVWESSWLVLGEVEVVATGLVQEVGNPMHKVSLLKLR